MPTQTTLTRVESFPFDSRSDGYDSDGYPVYDRAVGASMLRATFEKFFSDGVFPSPGDALQISKGSGLTVTIQPGIFIINGAMGGYLTDAHSLTLDTAAPQGNVCYGIMMRYDETEQHRSCYLRVVRGDAASSPQPPAPDQSTPGVMEYRLGYVTVPTGATDLTSATVTNEKGLEVCPYAAPFEEIDMSEVTADARNAANEAVAQLLAYFEQQKGAIDSALDDTDVTYLQQQITALQEQLADFDVDFGNAVDNFSIEYSSDNYPTTPNRLRVKDGGITQESLSQWLQIDLGIADTESWTYDDFKSMAQAAAGDAERQASLMGYLSSSIVTSWSDGQIVEFAGLLVDSCQVTFVGFITSTRAQQMSVSYFASLYDEVGSSAKSQLQGKVNLLSYDWSEMNAVHQVLGNSWAGSFVGQIKSVTIGSGTYQARLIGVGHDAASDGAGSTLTFQTTDSLSEPGYCDLPQSAYGQVRYSLTPLCTSYMPGVYEMMGSDVKPYIRDVVKPCSWNYGKNTENVNAKCFIISFYELFGSDHPCMSSDLSWTGDGSQYEHWSTKNAEVHQKGGGANLWKRHGAGSDGSSYKNVNLRTGSSESFEEARRNLYTKAQGTSASGGCNVNTVIVSAEVVDIVPCFCI